LKVWKPEITWKPVSEEIVKDTLEFVLNSQNHPVMIMGSSGINETGTVVGCLRRLQGWNLTSIIDEYRRFSGSKGKNVNELFIEMFDVTRISLPSSGNLPSWFLNNLGYSEKEKEMLERGIMISDLQKTYFDVYKCPLISEKVKYDKKKSICNDED
jgi:tyrosine-protein phosphatase SIW14